MSEIIERVARALFEDEHDTPSIVWEDADGEEKAAWCKSARAVLRAIREPSARMLDAGSDACHGGKCAEWSAECYGNARLLYEAMIDAALEEQV